MEVNWSELTIEKRMGQSDLSAAVESEIPVPEGREAARVLYAGGRLLPNASAARDGTVETNGTLQLQVLCVTTQNKPFAIRAAADYSSDIPMEQAKTGMLSSVTQQLTALRCKPEQGAISVFAELGMQALAASEEKQRILSSAGNSAGLEQQKTELPIARRAKALAHTLVLREEMPITNAAEVLLIEAEPVIREIAAGEGGVTVKGTLYTSALTMNEQGELQQNTAQLPIEEWIPNASLPPCPQEALRVLAQLTDITANISDDEMPVLLVDARIGLTVDCVMKESVHVVEDAYAPDTGMTAVQQTLERVLPASEVKQKCSVREMLTVPAYLPEAFRTVYAAGRAVVTDAADQDGELFAQGTLYATVVFTSEEGATYGFEEEVPFSCSLGVPYTGEADITARVLQIAGRGSGRELELTTTLELTAELHERRTDTVAVDMEQGDTESVPQGILIYLAGEGEHLWNVGRKFMLPQSAVRDWNPAVEEPLKEGQQLLLLKGKQKQQAMPRE